MRDLFDQISVTQGEIDAWLRDVPGIEPGTRRAAFYVQHWDVVRKIQRVKIQRVKAHAARARSLARFVEGFQPGQPPLYVHQRRDRPRMQPGQHRHADGENA